MLYWKFRYFINRLPERFWFWLAWHLPKRLVFLSTYRVFAHATTGKYSDEHPDNVLAWEMINRWHEDNELE